MKHALWLLPLVLAASCSSQDRTLGESKPSPHPVIVPDPVPNPDPVPDPNPNPNPDPDPNPDPNPTPNPTPSVPPCEDFSKHADPGRCVPMDTCLASRLITFVGYECDANLVCCDYGVGCGINGCGTGGSSGSAGMAQAGEGGDTWTAGGSP
jgi:hypothetical protein